MKQYPPNIGLSEFIARQFPEGYQGWAMDVGASDGVSINTTYGLEKQKRWTVISVEANPIFKDRLNAHRARVEWCALDAKPAESAEFHWNQDNPEAYSSLRPDFERANGSRWATIQVPVRTVDQVLDRWEFPTLDVLAVDVEGNELDVLRGCDLARWKPKVVIVEEWEEHGPASTYLKGFGYERKGRSVHNTLFVMKESG